MIFFTLILCVVFFSTSSRALFPNISGTWGLGSRDAFLALWLVDMGHVNSDDVFPMLMSHVTPKTIHILSFLRSDWLLPQWAIFTTEVW